MTQCAPVMNHLELPNDFPHQPPQGYKYKVQQHKRNVLSIWLEHPNVFSYRSDAPCTIWGFARNNKNGTTTYFSPANHKKMGKEVRISDTRNYTAMQLNLNPLEAAFV